jgi:hypothetical protein
MDLPVPAIENQLRRANIILESAAAFSEHPSREPQIILGAGKLSDIYIQRNRNAAGSTPRSCHAPGPLVI